MRKEEERSCVNMIVAPLDEALGVEILDKDAQRTAVIVSISTQIGRVRLLNASVAPDEQHGVWRVTFFLCYFLGVRSVE